jgi:hypothetical protein
MRGGAKDTELPIRCGAVGLKGGFEATVDFFFHAIGLRGGGDLSNVE